MTVFKRCSILIKLQRNLASLPKLCFVIFIYWKKPHRKIKLSNRLGKKIGVKNMISTRLNVIIVVQFHEIFVMKMMKKNSFEAKFLSNCTTLKFFYNNFFSWNHRWNQFFLINQLVLMYWIEYYPDRMLFFSYLGRIHFAQFRSNVDKLITNWPCLTLRKCFLIKTWKITNLFSEWWLWKSMGKFHISVFWL